MRVFSEYICLICFVKVVSNHNIKLVFYSGIQLNRLSRIRFARYGIRMFEFAYQYLSSYNTDIAMYSQKRVFFLIYLFADSCIDNLVYYRPSEKKKQSESA
jgi:hypothetical protein